MKFFKLSSKISSEKIPYRLLVQMTFTPILRNHESNTLLQAASGKIIMLVYVNVTAGLCEIIFHLLLSDLYLHSVNVANLLKLFSVTSHRLRIKK